MISSQVYKTARLFNAASLKYSFDFKIFSDAEIEVIAEKYVAGQKIIPVGQPTPNYKKLTLSTEFTVDGANRDTGGSITLQNPNDGQRATARPYINSAGTGLETGWTIQIVRKTALTQTKSIGNQEKLNRRELENSLDKLTTLAQELDTTKIEWRGEWNATTAYKPGDMVHLREPADPTVSPVVNDIFVCLAENTNQKPQIGMNTTGDTGTDRFGNIWVSILEEIAVANPEARFRTVEAQIAALRAGMVSAEGFLAMAISTSVLADDGVTAAKLNPDVVDDASLEQVAATGKLQIKDQGVTTAKIAAAAVTAIQLGAGASVGNIADNSLTPAKLQATSETEKKAMRDRIGAGFDGVVTINAPAPIPPATFSLIPGTTVQGWDKKIIELNTGGHEVDINLPTGNVAPGFRFRVEMTTTSGEIRIYGAIIKTQDGWVELERVHLTAVQGANYWEIIQGGEQADLGETNTTAAGFVKGMLPTAKMADDAVETAKIADDAVTLDKIASQGAGAATRVLGFNAAGDPEVRSVTGGTPGPNSVNTAAIQDNAVTNAKLNPEVQNEIRKGVLAERLTLEQITQGAESAVTTRRRDYETTFVGNGDGWNLDTNDTRLRIDNTFMTDNDDTALGNVNVGGIIVGRWDDASNGVALVFSVATVTRSALGTFHTFTGTTIAKSQDFANGNRVRFFETALDLVSTNEIQDDAVTLAKIASQGAGAATRVLGFNAAGDPEVRSVTGGTPGPGSVGTTELADDAVTLDKMAHGTANRYLGYDATGVPVELMIPTGTAPVTFTETVIWTGSQRFQNTGGNPTTITLTGTNRWANFQLIMLKAAINNGNQPVQFLFPAAHFAALGDEVGFFGRGEWGLNWASINTATMRSDTEGGWQGIAVLEELIGINLTAPRGPQGPPGGGTVTDRAMLDAIQATRAAADRDKVLVVDDVDENNIVLMKIDTNNLENDAVTSVKLESTAGAEAVTSDVIRENAVDGTALASDATNNANRAVSADHLRDGAVTTDKMPNDAVTGAKIAASAVGPTELEAVTDPQKAALRRQIGAAGAASVESHGADDFTNRLTGVAPHWHILETSGGDFADLNGATLLYIGLRDDGSTPTYITTPIQASTILALNAGTTNALVGPGQSLARTANSLGITGAGKPNILLGRTSQNHLLIAAASGTTSYNVVWSIIKGAPAGGVPNDGSVTIAKLAADAVARIFSSSTIRDIYNNRRYSQIRFDGSVAPGTANGPFNFGSFRLTVLSSDGDDRLGVGGNDLCFIPSSGDDAGRLKCRMGVSVEVTISFFISSAQSTGVNIRNKVNNVDTKREALRTQQAFVQASLTARLNEGDLIELADFSNSRTARTFNGLLYIKQV